MRHHHVQETQVSTHSRPKAAAIAFDSPCMNPVFQHTAARRRLLHHLPKAQTVSRFNTQPPEGGCGADTYDVEVYAGFQHTAARRRLHHQGRTAWADSVSTHSRPKAAGLAS